jgi:hypothetical protein
MSTATPDSPQPPDAGPDRLRLDLVRLVASTAGAVLAAVVLSRFGVAGTISGAALGSLIASIGTEVNQHYLSRSSRHLRELAAARRRAGRPDAPAAAPARPAWRLPGWLHWKALAALGVAGFVVAMLVITGFELAAGRPLAGVVGGEQGGGGRSTTVGELTGSGAAEDRREAPPSSAGTDSTSATTAPELPGATTTTVPTPTTAPGAQPSTTRPGPTGGRQQAPSTAPGSPGG